MSTIAVVVPLRPGARDEARRLLESGPPFDLSAAALRSHDVYLTDYEAVFVFEGSAARAALEALIGEASVWKAGLAWRGLLDGRPRLAEPAFAWRRPEPGPIHVPGL